MEVWFSRGEGRAQEVLRLHGQRPVALDPQELPGKLLVALQPVLEGIVQAWSPLARGWMTETEVRSLQDRLEGEGWDASPHRPLRGNGSPRKEQTPERLEMAREKDRQRKKAMRLRSDLLRVG
jgi:hypothetical protein